jgi:periplasmic divalent cation tolerance protein
MHLYMQVVTTTNSEEQAQQIANALVEARLAACVEIAGPRKSVYRWQGKIDTSTEWRLVIKTRAALFDEISEKIRELHSYELPQIAATEFTHVTTEYGIWIEEQTS